MLRPLQKSVMLMNCVVHRFSKAAQLALDEFVGLLQLQERASHWTKIGSLIDVTKMIIGCIILLLGFM